MAARIAAATFAAAAAAAAAAVVVVSGFLTAEALAQAVSRTSADVPPLPPVVPEAVGLAPAKLGESGALLARYVADRKIAGGVAAVARHGKLAWLEAVGVQDLESRARMTDRSIFRIYSMTKSVTAVAAMMLHEDGRFSLDDPVSKYLP